MARMKIGRLAGTSKTVRIADNSRNMHTLLVGSSGGGKSFATVVMAYSAIEHGNPVIAVDYSGSLHLLDNADKVNRIKVRESGIPLSLLTPIKRPDGSEEDVEDIADSIVDIFDDVSALGARQRAALRRAVLNAYKIGDKDGNEFRAIGRALAMDETEPAVSTYDRFLNLFTKVKTGKEKKLFEAGKLTIIDLSGFSTRTQRVIAEMVMAVIWRYFRVWGQYMERELYIICDEFQVLSLREDGVLSQILREGRKFHLALTLATQTLEGFNKSARAVIQQAATQMFFRPATSEISSVLKWIGAEKSPEMRKKLETLDIGECIAIGRFDVEGVKVERPVKVTFRTDKR